PPSPAAAGEGGSREPILKRLRPVRGDTVAVNTSQEKRPMAFLKYLPGVLGISVFAASCGGAAPASPAANPSSAAAAPAKPAAGSPG
ncbi:MAG TPA: hypothetical protein VIR57_07975, partial [Chloroflexota bacterium]